MLKNIFSIIIFDIFLSLLFTINLNADINELQSFPQTPKVPTEQQTKSPLKTEEKTKQPEKTTANSLTITPTNISKELKDNSDNKRQQNTDERTEFCILSGYKFRITDLALIAFNGLLFICTGFLALIAYWQYNAMILSQRAFVFVNGFNVIEISSNGPHVTNRRVTAILENSGTTGTKYLTNIINLKEFNPSESPENLDFTDISDNKPIYTSIGPKATIHSQHMDIPTGLLERVDWGQTRLYIWGWIEYNDVFYEKTRHRTEFCSEVVYHRGLMAFISYSKYNNVDDECYRKPSPYTPQT